MGALLTFLARSSPGSFALASALGVLGGTLGAGLIVLVQAALGSGGATSAGQAWIFAGVAVAAVATRTLSQAIVYRISHRSIVRLRRALIDSLLGARLRRVEEVGQASVYSALADDVVLIANAMPGVPLVIAGIAFVTVTLAYLLLTSTVVGVATLATAVVGVGLFLAWSARGTRHLTVARAEQDALFSAFKGVTEGVKELKLNDERRRVIAGDLLDRSAEVHRRESVSGLTLFLGAGASGQLVFYALLGALMFGALGLDWATVSSAVLVLLFAVSSLDAVLTWVPTLAKGAVALAGLQDRMAALRQGEIEDGRQAGRFDGWSRIVFEGVHHTYPGPRGEQFVLGPIDLVIRRGEVVLISGPNGSGKTTLAKLVTGLYLPEDGRVLVDGEAVGDHELADYRALFSAIYADFQVFDTVAGLPAAADTGRVARYLERLRLSERVHLQPDGAWSTTKLSTGQRKRLALVCALLEDRDVYLFDEWASDQDPVFKEVFYRELLAELRERGKTVVAITHDDRYFDAGDRLLSISDGRIEGVPHHVG